MKAICDNTAHMVEKGVTLKSRYVEILEPYERKKPEKEETRTAEEIIDQIKDKMKKMTGG